MAKVHTILGLVDRNDLIIKDVISEDDSSRIIATEWYLGEQLVRRDVNVNVLVGISFNGTQEGL